MINTIRISDARIVPGHRTWSGLPGPSAANRFFMTRSAWKELDRASSAIVHPAGSFDVATISRELESLLPADRRRSSVLIELVPDGRFVTYGIGVPLMDMRSAEVARAVVPFD